MHLDDPRRPVTLETHARDWRDEVIYQVLIDRFADGDDGNNYLLDRANMAHYHGGDWAGLTQTSSTTSRSSASPPCGSRRSSRTSRPTPASTVTTATGPSTPPGPNPTSATSTSCARWSGPPTTATCWSILDIVTNHIGQMFFYDINLNGRPTSCCRAPATRRARARRCRPAFDQHPASRTSPSTTPTSTPTASRRFTSLGPAGLGRRSSSPFTRSPATSRRCRRLFAAARRPTTARVGPSTTTTSNKLLTGDFPGGLKDVNTTALRREAGDGRQLRPLDRAHRRRRLSHRHRQARRARVLALLRPAGSRQRLGQAGQAELLHVRRGLRRQRRSWSVSSPRTTSPATPDPESATTARLSPATSSTRPSTSRSTTRAFASVMLDAQSTDRIAGPVGQQDRQLRHRRRQALSACIAPHKVLVNFIDNHDVCPPAVLGSAERSTTRAPARPAAQRAAPAVHRRGHPLPLLRHRARVSRRQRPQQPRGHVATHLGQDRPAYDTTGPTFLFTKKLIALRAQYPGAAPRRREGRLQHAATSTTSPTPASSPSSAPAATPRPTRSWSSTPTRSTPRPPSSRAPS